MSNSSASSGVTPQTVRVSLDTVKGSAARHVGG
jgi:hypothetical protein